MTASPEQYHHKNHRWRGEVTPFESCWRCGRAKARCRGKVRYTTLTDAEAEARRRNELSRYARPVWRYTCRWCGAYHLTSATGKLASRSVEKQRRRWLAKQAEEARSSANE